MLVMAPADENECRQMLTTGFRHEGPAAVRYPRGTGPGVLIEPGLTEVPVGRAQVRRRGAGLALLAFGSMVAPCEKIGAELDASMVNMRFVKPLDEALVLEMARTHAAIVTVEENALAGGAGSGVAELLAAHGIDVPVLHLGLPDVFLEHGSREELLQEAGLDVAGIRSAILERFPQFAPGASALRSAV
jgi:1-deoxy-D-xylulose-5-phosphate synthase